MSIQTCRAPNCDQYTDDIDSGMCWLHKPSYTQEHLTNLLTTNQQLLEALESLNSSLTQHDYKDALGRVKGTWSEAARADAIKAVTNAKQVMGDSDE